MIKRPGMISNKPKETKKAKEKGSGITIFKLCKCGEHYIKFKVLGEPSKLCRKCI